MGIFDIFSDQPAKDAAQAQIAGLNSGYNQASGGIDQAIASLTGNYGAGSSALTGEYGKAANALSYGYGGARDVLNSGYGDASKALAGGYGDASKALTSNYTAALQPYLANYGQASAGTNQLGNVLGLNGAAGSDAALSALRATPGYKFQQGTLDDTVNAAAAANGTLSSGNQLLALNKVNTGLADSTYNNYVSQLQPYLGASNAAAGGIANTYQGLGQGQANLATGLGQGQAGLALGQGQGQAGLSTGLAQAQAGLATGLGQGQAGISTNLGNATAGQQDMLAQLGYTTQTGIGNANANADLARYNASGNFWNMLGGIGGMKTSGGGTVGGNAISGAGSAISSAMPGIMAMFSDERLKEDIEPVGELYDGTNIYRYRYIGDPTPRIGLMAQEVEQTTPEAVIEVGGYKAVDYGIATQYASDLARFLEAA